MIISKRSILLSVLYFAILSLAGCSCLIMLGQESESGSNSFTPYAIAFTFIIWSVLSLRTLRKGYYFEKPSAPITLWTIFFLWGGCITFLIGSSTDISVKETISKQIFIYLPILIGNVIYYYILHNGLDKRIRMLFLIMCGMFLITYYSFYDIDNILLNIHLGSSYYSLYVLPLVMLYPSKTIKICSLFIVSLAVFSSVKRGGVMALLVGVFIYIIVKQIISKKSKTKRIVVGLSLIMILATIFFYIGTMGDNDIFERFGNIDKDNGSGRTEVWEETWRLITSQDVLFFMIGNGYNTVLRDSCLVLSAHNDFLETWYDYGLIGFILYVSCIIALMTRVINAIRNKLDVAAEFAMMFTIVFILTTISHVQLYFWINIVMLNIAVFLGYAEHYKRIK